MLSRRSLLSIATALTFIWLNPHAGLAEDTRLPVVASFSILGDLVKQVGGDRIELTTLVGPDGDAHVYEPAPADAKALSGARLLVVNGLDFEGWLPRLVKSSGFAGIEVVASADITPRTFGDNGAHSDEDHDHDHDHDHARHHHHGSVDPHAWQDIANGISYVKTITAALEEADPAHAETYRRNAKTYIEKLEKLNITLKERFASIPEAARKVVTSHDSFGYFGTAYGIDFIPVQGLSTEAEPSAADIAHIIDQIREHDIQAVFVENVSNTKMIDQILRETDARVGRTLFSDALSGPDGPAPSYIAMFEYNASELMKALQGD